MEEDHQDLTSSSSLSPHNSKPLINHNCPSDQMEPSTPSRLVDRLINANHHPSPSRTIVGDRFIPSRTSSNFSLFNVTSPKPGKPDEDSAYTALLRAALFGPDSGFPFPGTPDKVFGSLPPNRNIFRFKSETKRKMPSTMPFGPDDSLPGVNYSPVKTPRKVPRSPYKVLNCSALIFSFSFFSLGQRNCVCAWNWLKIGPWNWEFLWALVDYSTALENWLLVDWNWSGY